MNKNIIVVSFSVAILFFSFLVYKKIKNKKDLRRRVFEDGNPDYGETAKNIALSISKCKALYKMLIIQVHPDKFQDKLQKDATELSAKITKSKRNYNELLILEVEVKTFLEQ